MSDKEKRAQQLTKAYNVGFSDGRLDVHLRDVIVRQKLSVVCTAGVCELSELVSAYSEGWRCGWDKCC